MLDISALKGMTQEEQIKAAADYAGVPVGYVSGQWKQESNQGQHPTMMGPPTSYGVAKGHFQVLDSTHEKVQQKLGIKLDRFNFTESLAGYAEIMKENMQRYGNPDDAVLAYHGGWNKKNWGPVTKDYLTKVKSYAGMGASPLGQSATSAPVSRANPLGISTEQWMAGTADVNAADVQSAYADSAMRSTIEKVGIASTSGMRLAPVGQVDTTEFAQRTAIGGALEAEQVKKDEQSFIDTAKAGYRETMRPTFNVLSHIMSTEDGTDKDYVRNLAQDPSQVLKLIDNPTPDEVSTLLNTRSNEDLTLELGNINDRRENQAVLARASTGEQLAAMFIGGALDPMTYALGFGAAKSFAFAGVGAARLAYKGERALAAASMVGENVLGNVAYEAAQNLMGEHKSVADYGLAAATGLIPGAIAAPGAWRAGTLGLQRKLAEQAMDAQMGFLRRAREALGPDASPEDIRALGTQYEAQALATERVQRVGTPDKGNVLHAPDLDSPEFALEAGAETGAVDAGIAGGESISAMASPERHPLQEFQNIKRGDKTDISYAQIEGLTLNESRVAEVGLSKAPDEIKATAPGVHLDSRLVGDPWFEMQIKNLEYLRAKYLNDVGIHFTSTEFAKGENKGLDGFAAVLAPGQSVVAVKPGTQGTWTAAHELGHAIIDHYLPKLPAKIAEGLRKDYLSWLATVDSPDAMRMRMGVSRAEMPGAIGKTMRGEGDWKTNLKEAVGEEKAMKYDRYFKSFDEFGAEQFVKQVETDLEEAIAKGDMSPPQQLLAAFKGLIKRLLDFWKDLKSRGLTRPGEGFADFFQAAAMRQLEATAPAGNVKGMSTPKASAIAPYLQDVVNRYGLDTMDTTDVRGRAEQKAIAQLIYDSEEWLKANPQDTEKMRTVMKNALFDARTPGLILAESDNPVFKAIAGILVENTMGGSGRKVTAALRKAQWEREFVGNSVIAVGSHYDAYRNSRLGVIKGIADDLSEARTRREFNDAVYMEVNARSLGQDIKSAPEVKAAADALEVSYERMLKAQKDIRTVGWGALPDNSHGYMPRITDKRKWLTLSTARKQALHKALAEQFVERGEMDVDFAQRVASKYIDHISTNANGGHEIPANIHDPMALDYVNEAMRAAGMTEAEVRTFASRLARGGPSHTKARLDLDVLKEYTDEEGNTFRLMDLMETDPIELLRSQARRVSGEVALTQHGIMGSAGLKLLRRAAEKAQKATDPGHVKAMEAFDQVSAEMLGRPFGDEMPTWMEGALTANAASNLGFMGWMQMGELINTATGIGVMDTMKMVSDFPRIMQEVRVLAKGGKVENGILGSLEVSGAEFGLSGYKMITQYDNPSSIHAAVGRQDKGVLIKSMRVMGHKLGTVSLHRIIQATQVRGIAEQITKKALRYIREGKESKALADMGFTPDMIERIKLELPAIAKFEADGTLGSLDMTKAADPALVGDFIATINRGAGQLIQDTFIGEKGKWQHSNLGKVMTQFRSFPITAMEKQWGRMRGMYGAPAALGIIMAAAPMGFAMYAARTAVNAIGRPDAEAYLDKQFQPIAVGRGIMNYIGMLGLAPDVMDALTAVAVPDDIKKEWGLQNRTGQGPTIGGIVPVVGYGDNWLRAVNNLDNPHALVRPLPFSNAPWITPLINLLRPDN